MRWGYRITTKTVALYFKLLYRHKVYGLENLPNGPAIIAPNHFSLFDPPIIGSSINEELHFLAKEELFDIPVLTPLIKYLNAHPVSGSEKDLPTMKLICRLLQEGEKVVIFPEGSRSHHGQLLELKNGVSMLAIRNNVPIVPVYIKGTFEIWPMDKKYPSFCGRTSCTIGKPIYPDAYVELGKRDAQVALTDALTKSLLSLSEKC